MCYSVIKDTVNIFTMIRFINHLILVAKMCIGIFKYSAPLEIKFLLDRELNLRSIKTEKKKSYVGRNNDVRRELSSSFKKKKKKKKKKEKKKKRQRPGEEGAQVSVNT